MHQTLISIKANSSSSQPLERAWLRCAVREAEVIKPFSRSVDEGNGAKVNVFHL